MFQIYPDFPGSGMYVYFVWIVFPAAWRRQCPVRSACDWEGGSCTTLLLEIEQARMITVPGHGPRKLSCSTVVLACSCSCPVQGPAARAATARCRRAACLRPICGPGAKGPPRRARALGMNKKIHHHHHQFRRFFARWGLYFARWGL